MTDLRKVAQQALEALSDCIEKFYAMRSIGVIDALPLQAVSGAQAITALRAALAQPDVPQGWVLVPVEPTEEMTAAGAWSIIDGRDNRPGTSWAEEAQMAYRAMLAAAPKGGA